MSGAAVKEYFGGAADFDAVSFDANYSTAPLAVQVLAHDLAHV